MKKILLANGFLSTYEKGPKDTIIVTTIKGRCYPGMYSVFFIRVVNDQITYESHEISFSKSKDAVAVQKYLSSKIK